MSSADTIYTAPDQTGYDNAGDPLPPEEQEKRDEMLAAHEEGVARVEEAEAEALKATEAEAKEAEAKTTETKSSKK